MNSSTNCGSTASASAGLITGRVAACERRTRSSSTDVAASEPPSRAFATSASERDASSGRSTLGTRGAASAFNARMQISALSSMYHGSARPFCKVSM